MKLRIPKPKDSFRCAGTRWDWSTSRWMVTWLEEILKLRMPTAGIHPLNQGLFTILKNVKDKAGYVLEFQEFFWILGIFTNFREFLKFQKIYFDNLRILSQFFHWMELGVVNFLITNDYIVGRKLKDSFFTIRQNEL